MKKNILQFSVVGVILATFFAWAAPAYAWSYQIKNGDSLYLISQKFGTESPQALKDDNKLNTTTIYAGSSIWIPDQSQTNQTGKSNSGQDSVYLLARLINGEARGESFEGQVAVGAVILNRMESGKFPDTVAGNVFKAGQFESVSNGQVWQPVSDSCVKAAQAAYSGWDPTHGALYFYNPAKIYSSSNWIWSRPIMTQIGNHIFAH